MRKKNKMSLRKYMQTIYKVNPYDAVRELSDNSFLRNNGWFRVFREGYGEGVCSLKEGIVVVFDEDDLNTYNEYDTYQYNPKVWIKTDNGGWDKIYQAGN